jgi:hypothetical protein
MGEEALQAPLKEPNCRQLFVQRMERVGRKDEWDERIKVNVAAGMFFSTAANCAMRGMGCLGMEDERRRQQYFLEHGQDEVAGAVVPSENVANDPLFDVVLRQLPDTATTNVELDWIGAHTAMSRKARSQNRADIVLSADDVMRPAHGRAPSKRAVNALQHWAQHPAEFYKGMMSEQKRKMRDDADGNATVVKDMGLAEVERILKEMEGAE